MCRLLSQIKFLGTSMHRSRWIEGIVSIHSVVTTVHCHQPFFNRPTKISRCQFRFLLLYIVIHFRKVTIVNLPKYHFANVSKPQCAVPNYRIHAAPPNRSTALSSLLHSSSTAIHTTRPHLSMGPFHKPAGQFLAVPQTCSSHRLQRGCTTTISALVDRHLVNN